MSLKSDLSKGVEGKCAGSFRNFFIRMDWFFVRNNDLSIYMELTDKFFEWRILSSSN